MPSLSDFKPLESIELPELGTIDSTGLTLIVGPNSAGKSQLLRDVHAKLSGDARTLVVANAVHVARLDHDTLVRTLADEGLIYLWEDENGNPHIRPRTTYLGSGQAAHQIQATQGRSWYQATPTGARRRDEYLGYFGRFLVTALFLDNRLTSLVRTGLIDFVGSPPTHDLHALHLSDEGKAALLEEVRGTFSKAVWPDITGGTGICLRVSDEPSIPSAEDRHSPTKMATYRTIETEGDGLKSYVATCVALLLGRRPVYIIDEPEMCLHPPQAYALGRFIGKHASTKTGTTLVATHSSHVLRGVLQTAPKLQIIRLTRARGAFRAHLVASGALENALAKPTVRAETVLDGLFAQAVLILEADSDRTVYQAVWETLGDEFRLDIHFTGVGGTGGIADTCALYRTLRIPVAIVADLDVVLDTDKLRRILESLGASDIATLMSEAAAVSAVVKMLPPTITAEEAQSELAAVAGRSFNWSRQDDADLAKRLRALAVRLDRMRRLKAGGITAVPDSLRNALVALIDKLRAAGLFVVPVGELEEWLSGAGIQASRHNKWAWANEAAAYVRARGAERGDVWDFMRTVGAHLAAQYEQ